MGGRAPAADARALGAPAPEPPAAPRVWLITGASRGIGRALVSAALERGEMVVAGYRDVAKASARDRLVPVSLDVTRPDDCRQAVEAAEAEFGRLDVVANVAGVGLVGAVEETPLDLARSLFEVNFWGVANMLAAALPALRAQRHGHVLQISSLSGRIAAPGVGYYAASKFALEGLSEALHAELAPLGVRVTIVEPGGVRTEWAGASLWSAPEEIGEYAPSAGATRELLARVDGKQPSTPDQVAAAIVAVVDAPEPPRRAPVTADAVQRIGTHLEDERAALRRWGSGG